MIKNEQSVDQISSLEHNLIKKHYNKTPIEFIERNEKLWIASSVIARGLEIHKDNVLQIYGNNKELLEPYSTTMKIIVVDNKRRNTRVFDKVGFIGICMRSNSPKAIPFQKWVLSVIEEIERKGYYIEKKTDDPFEILVKQADMLKQAFIHLKEQNEKITLIENKVTSVDTELKSFEQKYDDEKIITPQTKKRIRDIVHAAVLKTGNHYNFYYSKIWQKFDISSTTDISEKLGREIITWLKNNNLEDV